MRRRDSPRASAAAGLALSALNVHAGAAADSKPKRVGMIGAGSFKEVAMHGASLCVRIMVLLLALDAAGCLPRRGDVSPDGRTFYFSMMVPTEKEGMSGSPILALDAETGRLRALTDSGGGFWCCLSPDGKFLTYMGPVVGAVSIMDLEKGEAGPLTGVLDGYGYPRLIQMGDGEKVFGLLAKTTRGLGSPGGEAKDSHWVVMSQSGAVPLPDLEGYEAGVGEVVTLSGAFVVPVHRLINAPEAAKGDPKKHESALFAVDVSEYLKATKPDAPKSKSPPAPPKAALLAKWAGEGDSAPVIDLALSSDREEGRLVAAVPGQGPGKDSTQFFEIFPPEKGPPKLLFEDAKARCPQWTPDGKAIVYLRVNTVNNNWQEVVLWRPEAKEPVVLARLPNKSTPHDETCITTWRWLPDGRLRIYNVEDGDGIRLVETAADGTGAKARRLNPDRLVLQVNLALTDRAMHSVPPLGKVPASPLNDKTKPAVEAAVAAAKSFDEAREKLWQLANDWDEVPAIPPVPVPPKATPAAPAPTEIPGKIAPKSAPPAHE